MTIEELREEKIKVEAEILHKLREFQVKCGVSVERVDASFVRDSLGRSIITKVVLDLSV